MGRVAFESGAPGELFERYPTIVLWANGQAKRVDAVAANRVVNTHSGSVPDIGSSVATVLFKWNQDLDEEYFDGEDTIGLSFITSSAARAADADAQALTTNAGDGVYFKLAKAGLYRFSGAFKSGTIVDGQQVRIFKVVAGDTDELIAESTAGIRSECGLGLDHYFVSGIQKTPPVEVDGETTLSDGTLVPVPSFYVINGDDDTLGQQSHYMELEYLGPA